MPARDFIHDAVKNALIKDGWTITDDPYLLDYGDVTAYPDLGADRSLSVERNHERLVVEIKSFQDRSTVYQLEHAIGQYEVYRFLLKEMEDDSPLYLAVTEDVFIRVFQRKAVDLLVKELGIRILTINPATEEIVQWIRRCIIASSLSSRSNTSSISSTGNTKRTTAKESHTASSTSSVTTIFS